MRIIWRYICYMYDPVRRRCLWWMKIPIIIDVRFWPPEPPPWLGGEKIRPELAQDLQVLATIDALAQTLSGKTREAALEWVQGQFDALEMPENMRVVSEQSLKEG